jgi:uncharacterized ParB-like nuclease family protein
VVVVVIRVGVVVVVGFRCKGPFIYALKGCYRVRRPKNVVHAKVTCAEGHTAVNTAKL